MKRILTSAHPVIVQVPTIRRRSRRVRAAGIATDDATAALRVGLQSLGDSLGFAGTTGARAGSLAICRAQQLPDLKEVGFERVHQSRRLPVLRGRAEGNRLVFDDVSDAEAVGGCGTEAKVAQTRVPAVRGGQHGVVDFVPAGVGEDGWCWGCGAAHGTAVAAAGWGGGEAVFGEFGELGGFDAVAWAGVSAGGAGVGEDTLVEGALPETV